MVWKTPHRLMNKLFEEIRVCVLEKGQKGLVQIHVFFMTVPLLGAKFCLGPCTDVFPAMQRGGRVLIPTSTVCFC